MWPKATEKDFNMSQHDFNIANQGFPAFRSDLNNALAALASTSSGASAPSTTYANQFWYDETNNIIKMRNEANSGWISIGFLDQTSGFFYPFAGATAVTVSASDINAVTAKVPRTTSTGSALIPTGTNGERDGTPAAGYFRFNTTLGKFEGYSGSAWGSVGGGATGGGSDDVFYENGQTVTANYTITNGKNAMSAGPITINSGVTVTVGTGEVWTIV
jgi:hypothetical protein